MILVYCTYIIIAVTFLSLLSVQVMCDILVSPPGPLRPAATVPEDIVEGGDGVVWELIIHGAGHVPGGSPQLAHHVQPSHCQTSCGVSNIILLFNTYWISTNTILLFSIFRCKLSIAIVCLLLNSPSTERGLGRMAAPATTASLSTCSPLLATWHEMFHPDLGT